MDDIEAIQCEMQTLAQLRAKAGLDGLDEKLAQSIKDHEANIRELMAKCGLPMLTGKELVEGIKGEE